MVNRETTCALLTNLTKNLLAKTSLPTGAPLGRSHTYTSLIRSLLDIDMYICVYVLYIYICILTLGPRTYESRRSDSRARSLRNSFATCPAHTRLQFSPSDTRTIPRRYVCACRCAYIRPFIHTHTWEHTHGHGNSHTYTSARSSANTGVRTPTIRIGFALCDPSDPPADPPAPHFRSYTPIDTQTLVISHLFLVP